MVGWSRRNNVITSPGSLWRSGLRHKKTFSWWTFICWKKMFLISDHWNHTLTFTLHVSECQCVYARARIAFVLKLYYLSTIFCQQQHMFAGRRHLTYPAWLPHAHRARAICACLCISRVGYVWWRAFGGFKKAAISIQSIFIYPGTSVQLPGWMKNSSYYIAPVGDWTHDLPHTVASNMVTLSDDIYSKKKQRHWWKGYVGTYLANW